MIERYTISGTNGFIGSHMFNRVVKDGKVATKIGRHASYLPLTDVFVDCAAYGNMNDHKDVSEIYEANVHRAINLILKNRNVGYDAFISFSTSAVTLPTKTYYSASKAALEDFCAIFARETGKPVVIVRPYSITGVGEQRDHLIPTLIRSAHTGEQIPFVPGPVHDFLDVDNFIDAISIVIQNAESLKGQVVPIGSGKQYSNLEILQKVEKLTKKINVEIVDNLRSYDTKEWVADTSLMYSLGWEATKTIDDTIKEMVEDYERKNL